MMIARKVSLIILITMLLGCVSNKPALDTIATLEENNAATLAAHKRVMKTFTLKLFEQQKSKLKYQIQAKKAELKLQIFEKINAKEQLLVVNAMQMLEQSIEPQIQQLNSQVKAARQNSNRIAEIDAALKLSATMARLGEEQFLLRNKIASKINELRVSTLLTVDPAFENADILSSINSEQLAEEILTSYFNQLDKNRATTADAYKQLERHVDIHRLAMKQFVDSALPEGGIQTIAELFGFDDLNTRMSDKLEHVLSKGQSKLQDISKKILTKASAKLDALS